MCKPQALPAAALSDLHDVEVSVHTPKPGPAVPRPPAEAAQPDLMAATGAQGLAVVALIEGS
jgi:hypothetical protein